MMVAGRAENEVVAIIALDRIVSGGTVDRVRTRPALKQIVAIRADLHIVGQRIIAAVVIVVENFVKTESQKAPEQNHGGNHSTISRRGMSAEEIAAFPGQ